MSGRQPYLGKGSTSSPRQPYLGKSSSSTSAPPPKKSGGGSVWDHISHAAGSVGHVVAKTGEGLAHDFSPGGLYKYGKGVYDIGSTEASLLQQSFEHPWVSGKSDPNYVGNSPEYKHAEDIIHGLEKSGKETFTHPLRHPDQSLLNVLALYGGARSLDTHLTAAGDAEGFSGSLKALAKPPKKPSVKVDAAAQRTALRLRSKNMTPDQAIEFHRGKIEKGVDVAAHKRQIALLERVKSHGLLRQDEHGHVVVDATKHPELASIDLRRGGVAEQIRAALPGAKNIRGRQEAGYSQERAARATKAEAAMQKATGIEGYHAALGELKGELPKINFDGFKELNKESLDHLFLTIRDNPHLMTYQKITATKSLMDAFESGKVPTRSELVLLEHVFGKETASSLAKVPTAGQHTLRALGEFVNIPRSVMASFDLSAPFRQGLVAGARHPAMFAKNFKPMIKAFGSEKAYGGIMDDVVSRPTYPLMMEGKLALTSMEHATLTSGEEQWMYSNMAEKIPVAGKAIRMSGRAYVGFLVKMRADMFDHLIQVAQKQGINVQDPEFLKSLGTYINSATGRGSMGKLQGSATALNSVFFSPRLLASRVNFLNPVWYAKLDPFVRQQALRSLLQLSGAVGVVLALAEMGGAHVGSDPRNADFAKIRFGNTRYDILGGFQQPIRIASQLATGKIISSTTGKTLSITSGGYGKVTRQDIVLRFFEGKLAPTPSVINDWFKGTDFQSKPFSWKKEIVTHMTPLLAQDATALYFESNKHGQNGIARAFGGYGLGMFGIGIQTYGSPANP